MKNPLQFNKEEKSSKENLCLSDFQGKPDERQEKDYIFWENRSENRKMS